MWTAAAVSVAAAALAYGLRFGLIEPVDEALRCDAAPWSDAACVLRSLTVQSFANHGLGWSALAAGFASLAFRRPALAWLGLGLGWMGMVLYTADASVLGLLASWMGLSRATRAPRA
jgi:hypothetical protein